MVMTTNSKTPFHVLSGIILAVALAACGGGGGASGTAEAPLDGTRQAASSTGSTRQIFIDGIYQLSGANFFINGVSQAEIKKTSLPETTPVGVDVTPATSHYAGMQTLFSGFIFDSAEFETLSADGWTNGFVAKENGNVLNFGSDNEAVLSSPAQTGPNSVPLGVIATTEQAAGQSIEDYIDTVSNGTLSADGAEVFSGNAKLISLTYRTLTDFIILGGHDGSFELRSLDDFSKSGRVCYSNNDRGTALLVQFNGAGNFSLYDTSTQSAWCEQVKLDSSTPKLGNGTYEQKSFAGVKYLELQFPTGFDVAKYDDSITTEQIAAGLKELVVDEVGGYGLAHARYVPKGVISQDREKYLDKEAADQVKAALKLQ